MVKKNIIALILMVGVISSSSMIISNVKASNDTQNGITVMPYKASAKVNTSGYQIDKFDKVESAAWLSNNEVLTLTKKAEVEKTGYYTSFNTRYCSIYNLNTKTSKDFKDVNISVFIGVSPDKKYVLYQEPKYIASSQEGWQKSFDSGELMHSDIKILNLSTGEVSKFNTEYNNHDVEYKWINNNKILANYHNKWSIIGIDSKVYAQGDYKKGEFDDAWISGTDIKDSGDTVEGKIYYTQWENGKIGTTLLSIDVKTKEIKSILFNKNSLHAEKQGKTIIMDNYTDNGEISPGVYNRSFGAYILDENGKILKDIKLPECNSGNFMLSPDGSKAAYAEGNAPKDASSLKVIDTKTGEIKEVMKCSTISNICWDSSGTSLSFTSGNSSYMPISISLDTKNGTKVVKAANSAVKPTNSNENNNIDTYIVNFDN
jgi:hypothetical protein